MITLGRLRPMLFEQRGGVSQATFVPSLLRQSHVARIGLSGRFVMHPRDSSGLVGCGSRFLQLFGVPARAMRVRHGRQGHQARGQDAHRHQGRCRGTSTGPSGGALQRTQGARQCRLVRQKPSQVGCQRGAVG